ncbi:DUF6282 family protein [Saccharomonospora sp. NPDC046836]|uniref:DUF6282 family protein n=1 Tax=Saccharomonospora sp. NPDC046836 TaxID=3156921 RepID=UPI0033E32992
MVADQSTPRGDRDILTAGDNRILRGAVDMHVHGYPDADPQWRARLDDRELCRIARDCGMRGLVLKSHFWPTMDRARILTEQLADPDFTVFSSITLNPLVGGLQPSTVEAAARHGARVVYLPTWGSVNDSRHPGLVRREIVDPLYPRLRADLEHSAVSVLDGNAVLRPEAREILVIAAELGLVVSTGHLAVAESLALARESASIGFDRLVFGHPFSPSIEADLDVIKEMADLGATIEMTAIHTLLPRSPVDLVRIHEAVVAVGAENVVLSSDVYLDWMPPHVEMLRLFCGQLRQFGLGDDALRTMLVDKPRALLGVPPPQLAGPKDRPYPEELA